jgi:1,4-dihydroxy-6-naphthoate synthase
MGERYGPVVVARKDGPSSITLRVAIPGELTTSFLALGCSIRPSSIVWCRSIRSRESASSGEVAAGLLIHEGQLIYEDEDEEDRSR